MYKFIDHPDDLSDLLNTKANELFDKINLLDIGQTNIDDFGKYYFSTHHTGQRLFYSLESSADIIYRSVKSTGKPMAELSFTDYGAGLGTLFLLAGTVGFKQVFFNDLFPVWGENAKEICHHLDIQLTDYIIGDIETLITYGKNNHTHFDIIASRNVIEHVYSLRTYYQKLYESKLTTVIYATTTANFHNLAMRYKHYWYHAQLEKKLYKKQREDAIKNLVPSISQSDLKNLVSITRGRALQDFANAVNNYIGKKEISTIEFLRTNTCDHNTGVWAENIITRKNYYDIIETAGFKATYEAGFWDTHYHFPFINFLTKGMNILIRLLGKKGYWLSPFVNVVAQSNSR